MSKPVNLNKARKARARQMAKDQADRNAVAFGRTKAQKTADKTAREKAEQTLDAHRREPE